MRRRSDVEVIHNIIPHLHAGRRRAEAERDIAETIARLRLVCGNPQDRVTPTQGFDRANRDWLDEVRKHAARLRKTLDRPPEGVGTQILHVLFASRETASAQDEGLSEPEQNAAIALAYRAAVARMAAVEEVLETLEARAQQLLSQDWLGEHGHFDQVKWRIGMEARRLLERWRQPVTYSNSQSPFAQIAYQLCRSIGLNPTRMEKVLKAVRDAA
jgi:hypothetical protein